MAKPTNLGTYNQNIEFADENVFEKAFDEGRERQKGIIEEAYAKKKDKFIDDFYTDLRYKIMQPKGSSVVRKDEKTGQMRLNKGFYDISKIDPEDILREAKRAARKAGLPSSYVKRTDILGAELNALYNEAAKRQFKQLAAYKDTYGDEKFETLMRNETKAGSDWHQFYQQFYDPWSEIQTFADTSPKDWTVQHGQGNVHSRQTQAWEEKMTANGWRFNDKGQVTSVPGMLDPGVPVNVNWDSNGAYVNLQEAGTMTGFISWDSINPFRGQGFLDHWGGKTKKRIQ